MSPEMIIDWARQTGIAVSILIVMILAVRRPLARRFGAKAAYALWALPVIRLFMPAIPILAPETAVTQIYDLDTAPLFSVPVQSSSADITMDSSMDVQVILLFVWFAGILFWLIYQFYQQHAYRMSLDLHSKSVSSDLEVRARNVTQKLGMKWLPEIRQSENGDGPLVTGLFYPVIILPNGFENNFSSQQQELTLAHELSHIQRRDLWASVAALIFRAINWPNPLVHLAARAFRSDQEAACDQTVLTRLGSDQAITRHYAQTLIHAARFAGNNARPNPLGLTIFTPLKERLMILKTTQKANGPLRLAASILALGALAATAPLTASAGPDTETHNVEKKVMKWVTMDGDVETKRHIEITTENGVTTAYEIDEFGNKTVVDLDTLDMPDVPHPPGAPGEHKMRVHVKNLGDGDMSDAEIEALLGEHGIDLEEHIVGADREKKMIVIKQTSDIEMMENGESKIIMKSINDGKGTTINFSGDEEFEFHTIGEGKADMMVGVASDMLEKVDTSEMARSTRKKVEQAQEALREAKEALAEEAGN